MAYKGEDIPIVITGDDNTNLDDLDFKILIYPHDDIDNYIVLGKTDMKAGGANTYTGQIPHSETKDMPIGYYTIEVLSIGDDKRRIFKKEGAFTLYDSASKNVVG